MELSANRVATQLWDGGIVPDGVEPVPPVEESLDALLLRSLLDESEDRVYFKDVESRFLRLSHSAAEWFGAAREQVVGRTDGDYFGEQHAQQARDDEAEIMRTGVGLVNVIERETWPDKPDTWVSSTKLPLRDSGRHDHRHVGHLPQRHRPGSRLSSCSPSAAPSSSRSSRSC